MNSRSRIIPVGGTALDLDVINEAVAILEQGRFVVAPTETRYGLLARADREDVLGRMFELKNRPDSMPTSIFCGSIEELWTFGQVTDEAKALAERFLPGPMTLVLTAKKRWNKFVTPAGLVGLRYSPSMVIKALVAKAGFSITATSANISGMNELESVGEIEDLFGDRVDYYLDGGRLTGASSTVVKCTGGQVKVLREGMIPVNEITNFLKANSSE